MNSDLDMMSILNQIQKRAVFKLAVDLAKADKQIHGNEVALLNSLQDELNMSKEELDMVHGTRPRGDRYLSGGLWVV